MKQACLSMLAALMLTSYAVPADSGNIVEELSNPSNKKGTYDKLLVVGITDDDEARRRFEDKTVTFLRAREIGGLTSYDLAPDLVNIGVEQREELVSKLIGQKVDGFITVRLVPLVDQTEEEWAASWKTEWSSPITVRDYIKESLPVQGTKAKKFGAVITLWDMKSRARVWSGRTTAAKLAKLRKQAGDSLFEVINSLVLGGFV